MAPITHPVISLWLFEYFFDPPSRCFSMTIIYDPKLYPSFTGSYLSRRSTQNVVTNLGFYAYVIRCARHATEDHGIGMGID